MTTVDGPKYKVIGTRPIRPDGIDKVTGKAQYGADIRLPGLVYGRMLRSPHAHARILSIDTSAAETMPGVLAVATARDLPAAADKIEEMGEQAVNIRELSDNILASEKVLYHGHAVAGVAALTAHQAENAAKAIKVEYEVLPAVIDVRDAMRPDAPILSERRRTKQMGQPISDAPSNIANVVKFEGGDVDAAFAEADLVLEREFDTRMVHQGYIEPHNATCSWNVDGTLTIWTSTQGSFAIRGAVAQLLRMPVGKIRVIPMEIGGGFGGKLVAYLEPVGAVLSRKCGRPVKLTMSRTDVFQATGPTSGTHISVKVGFKGTRITAVDGTLLYEAGAYAGAPVGAGAMCMTGPYNIENFRLTGYDVVVNKPKTAAYRAPGAPAASFAFESALDEAARTMGVDPLQLRIENAAREGTKSVAGVPFPRIGAEETARAAFESPHYRSPIEGPNRGRGVASGFWFNGGMQSSVSVGVNTDGTVNLIEGSVDIGGSRASLSMQLAESLGVPYESIRATIADTDSIGHNDVTGGSRTTFATGLAIVEAAEKLKAILIERASKMLDVPADDLEYENAEVRVKGGIRGVSFNEIAAKSGQTGGPLFASNSVQARGVGAAYGTHIVDVEVDPGTGKVKVLRYTAAQDVGTAIHPSYVEGQIQGGAAQGIGWALNEEFYYADDGRLLNSSYLDYRMPTSLDLPMIETILVEVPNPGHPYGVRGVGEVPIVPPLAAIANAVAEATGHRFTELPLSARRVVEELHHLG